MSRCIFCCLGNDFFGLFDSLLSSFLDNLLHAGLAKPEISKLTQNESAVILPFLAIQEYNACFFAICIWLEYLMEGFNFS